MSYQSRVYRQRNPQVQETTKKEAFFSASHDQNKSKQNNSFFQAKLSVNQPGDSYEHQADHVANAVVNKSSQAPMVQQKKISGIQRLATPVDYEKLATNDERMKKDKEIQKKSVDTNEMDEKKKIQKKDDGSSSTASSQLSSRISNSAGKGNQMPKHVLHEMNSSFGVDFSGVKIHHDSNAADMNQELQAQAFTHGRDIYFNQGKYNPENAQGKFLLAHELTHVVQQNAEENKLQRKVNANLVSCRNPTPEIALITGPDPVSVITDANTRAVELLDNTIDELQTTRTAIVNGATPSSPTISDNLATALQNRFQMDASNAAIWTGTGEGTVHVLIRRYKMIRGFLDSGGLAYTCLAGARINTPTCAGDGCGAQTRAVSCEGNSRLFLCVSFWGDNNDDQAGTLMHESFHMYFGFIKDAGFLTNAHCYEQFVLDINNLAVSPLFANSCA